MTLLLLAVLFPLCGFILNGFLAYSKIKKRELWTKLIGPLAPFLSFLTILLHYGQWGRVSFYEWASLETLKINFAFQFDSLSFFMGLIVTGIGFLIHLYSVGYMSHDKGFSRFFSYLNLFITFMLLLVLADNLWVMFIGWEGVGLASYLLIGFWYEESQNARAGAKAFVTNRLGDLGFLVGIFLLSIYFSDLSFSSINMGASTLPLFWLEVIGISLFIGASGKSAQVPLHIWLADAMAGPTPVSALIHAATMVTAGIFMMARLNGLFVHAELTLSVVAILGTATAFIAACLALIQNDIKKILAYSTVSQLGFMAAAIGAKAFSTSLFHLYTHAFFKATLFLAAGALIHSLGGEQDITKMGGQRKKNKWNFYSFLVGSLALAGIFPTSGFFSKDDILLRVYSAGDMGKVLFAILLLTAVMTAYYIFRAVIYAFGGEERKTTHHSSEHGNEDHHLGFVFYIPVVFLALGSLVVGFTQHQLHEFYGISTESQVEHLAWMPYVASIASLLGIGLAFLMAKKEWLPTSFKKLLEERFYFDWFFESFAMPLVRKIADLFCLRFGDAKMIDGSISWGSQISFKISELLCRLVNGQTQVYLFSMFIALIFVISWWVYAQ